MPVKPGVTGSIDIHYSSTGNKRCLTETKNKHLLQLCSFKGGTMNTRPRMVSTRYTIVILTRGLWNLAEEPHFLMIFGNKQYQPYFGRWNFPGGKYESSDGGDPLRCAHREIIEEVGREPKQLACLGRYISISPTHTARCDIVLGWLPASPDEQVVRTRAQENRWIPASWLQSDAFPAMQSARQLGQLVHPDMYRPGEVFLYTRYADGREVMEFARRGD